MADREEEDWRLRNTTRRSLPALLILKKQSQDERFPSHLKGSSTVDSFPNMEPDSLLLPFVNNPQPSEKPEITRLSNKTSPRRSNSDDDTLERDINACALPNKDQERAQRVEFVRGLLLSNIFKDDL
ncbi:hypothetical protein M9H77_01721 [Catharanthus roseus]|uniref:Uncharacterized protein n=1 Tax=Catharanthus roseus TaxID=4058 RepID=A0ACC0C6C0_CATRO|nr:hypothetical protein M9H77_01721 [Catharanthus roseus]